MYDPMLGKPRLMSCGHVGDMVATDVPSGDELIDCLACSFCFDDFGTVKQPACILAKEKDDGK